MSAQEFTGERFILGQGGVQLAYEHLHRYLFASRFAPGKKALDVASGSGYGSALLARVAQQVWAVDIDGPTVAHARSAYGAANLSFVNADGSCLPIATGSVELITAFEVIEHLPNQKEMIRELARVLKPGGLVLISTPDKAVYSDARKYVNPFHLREFYRDEFIDLLNSEFPFVRLLFQQIRAGSLISEHNSARRSGEVLVSPIPSEERSEAAPMYFLAFCSNCHPPQTPEDSVYLDPADSLFLEWARQQNESSAEIERLNEEIRELGEWGIELEGQLAERDRTIERLQSLLETETTSRDDTIRRLQLQIGEEVQFRDRIIRELQDEIVREAAQRDETIRKQQEDFEERTQWVHALQETVRDRDDLLVKTNASLDATDASLKEVSAHLALIRRAFLYRVLCRMGILPK